MEKLLQILPQQRIKDRLIDVLSYASDTGFYKLVPKAVVQPANEAEIIALFLFCHKNRIPMVFRTGGNQPVWPGNYRWYFGRPKPVLGYYKNRRIRAAG